MKLFKFWINLAVFLFAISAFAKEGQIALHLECPPGSKNSKDCVEIQSPSDPGKMILIKKSAEMKLSKSQISNARIVKDEQGRDQLSLELKKSAAERFKQLTNNNINKVLVIISKGKAIINPKIQEIITNGLIILSAGKDHANQYLNDLPWLKKMIEKKSKEKPPSH